MKKFVNVLLFGLMALILGAIAGAILWLLLKVINMGIGLVWNRGSGSIIYNLIICCAGAVFIGFWQRKYGILPDNMEQVMAKIKKDGKYPYDRLGIIAVAAVVPLIMGSALGPEAGLAGVIAGLCCWVGDSLKSRGNKLAKLINASDGDSVETLAETGLSVVLGVIFRAPLYGIVGNIEPDDGSEKYKDKFLKKKGRIFIYCMGVIGGFLSLKLFGYLFALAANASGNEFLISFAQGGGLPRFTSDYTFSIDQWKWSLLFIAAGIVLALIYNGAELVTGKLADKIKDKRILSCLIAGISVAIVGFFFPNAMFSGEHQLGELISDWQSAEAFNLVTTAVIKLLLVNICLSFGIRGGSIFPMIFSASAAGFGIALLLGVDGSVAAALVLASMYAYISRKPLVTVAILLLCFPITYIIPIFLTAFVASKIPTPFKKAE